MSLLLNVTWSCCSWLFEEVWKASSRRHSNWAGCSSQLLSASASDVHTWVFKGKPGEKKEKKKKKKKLMDLHWTSSSFSLICLSFPPFFSLLFRHDEGVGPGCVPVCSITSLWFITVFVLCMNMCVLPCEYKAHVYCVQYDVSLWETEPTVMLSEINLDFKCQMNVSSMNTCVKMPHLKKKQKKHLNGQKQMWKWRRCHFNPMQFICRLVRLMWRRVLWMFVSPPPQKYESKAACRNKSNTMKSHQVTSG